MKSCLFLLETGTDLSTATAVSQGLLCSLLSQILLSNWTADFLKPSPVANLILSYAYSVCVTPTELLICWVIVVLLLPVVHAPAMWSLSHVLVLSKLSASCMSWQAVPCSSCSFALKTAWVPNFQFFLTCQLNLKSLICWQPLLSIIWENVSNLSLSRQ